MNLDDNNKLVSMEPVHVTVVGGTGDGGMSKQIIDTPAGQPTLIATFVPTATAILVRFIDTFLTVLLSVTGVGAITSIDAVKALVPSHVALGSIFEEALFFAFVAASFGLLKDMAVIVSKLKRRFPLLDI